MESSGIHVLRPAASKYPTTTNCPTPSINPIDEQTVKRFQLTFAVPAINGTTQATGPSKRAKIKIALPRFSLTNDSAQLDALSWLANESASSVL